MGKELYNINDFLDYVDYYYNEYENAKKVVGKYKNGVYEVPNIKVASPHEYLSHYFPNKEFIDVNTIYYYYEKILHYAYNHELYNETTYNELNELFHSYFVKVIGNIMYLTKKEKEDFINNLR